MPTILLFLLLILDTSLASITINISPYTNYDSLPAAFGTYMASNKDYPARLLVVPGDADLCSAGSLSQLDEIIRSKNTKDEDIVLLAERGGCTYEHKGRIATQYQQMHKNIKYVIVYDDKVRNRLIKMEALDRHTADRDVSVGLLFTYHKVGVDLMHLLKNEGILELILDGANPPYSPLTPIFGSYFGFFLSIILCCGGLAVCCHAGFIRTEGNHIIVGPREVLFDIFEDGGEEEELMTEDQVLALPQVFYKSYSHQPLSDTCTEEFITSCSICLEDYEDGEVLRQLPCGHQFHLNCIGPWLTERQSLCPLCKFDLLAPDSDSVSNGADASSEIDRSRGSSQYDEYIINNITEQPTSNSNDSTLYQWIFGTGFNNDEGGTGEDEVGGNELHVPLLENQPTTAHRDVEEGVDVTEENNYQPVTQ